VAPTELAQCVVIGLGDTDDALLLSDEAHWNQTAADWAVFMTHGECYGIRADGRLVASAAILPFVGGFGWVSMVLVTSDWRRRGLASQLMNRCIGAMRARGSASLLDATPEGALVYGQLGFQSKCGMSRWRGMGSRSSARPSVSSTAPDRAAILACDLQVFGGDRGALIEDFLDRPGTQVIGDEGNFVLLRAGRRGTQIGPLVSQSQAEACELLESALACISGSVIIDVLDAGACLEPVLLKHGFKAFRTFERMILDRVELPGMPSRMMVAAGPEFG